MKKLTSLFCTLLLLLAIFPLASANTNIGVQAKWVVNDQPYNNKQLNIDQYETAEFYVAVDYPGTSDDYNLNVGIYNEAGNKIANPVYVSSEKSETGTEFFSLEYTPTTIGNLYVAITAYTDSSESSAELELIVACSDVDSDNVCDDNEVLGCTNPEAENYNSEATEDDGSCVLSPVINGDNHVPTMSVDPKADGLTALIFPTYELKTVEDKVITVTGHDADGDDLTFSFVSSDEQALPEGLVFTDNGDNTATIDISSLNAGSYGARIAVSDGQDENFWVLIFKVTENHAPTFELNPKADSLTALIFPTYDLFNGQDLVVNALGHDIDGDDLTFSFESSDEQTLPSWLSYVDNNDNTGTMTITSAQPGSYGVKVTVSDGFEEYYWPVIFKVTEDTNTAPVMDNLGLVEVNEGEVKTIIVSATDVNGQDLTYQYELVENDNCNGPFDFMCVWDNVIENLFGYINSPVMPDYVTLNSETGEFTISPDYDFVKHPSTEKTVQFQFRAHDGFEYSAWEMLTVKVSDVNQIPEVNFDGNTPFEEDKQLSITVTATDADSEDDLDMSIEGVPGWATAETNEDGSISIVGTPQEGDAGEYTIVVTISDGITTVEVTYTFTVNPAGTSGEVYGCTDSEAYNYDSEATVDDGSCEFLGPDDVLGCTDETALNYNSEATIDDGSCEFFQETYGCTDSEALNYNIAATNDDNSCEYQSHTNAFFEKAQFAQDVIASGDYGYLSVKISNNGDEDMSNLKVSAMIYDLGVKATSSKFTLDEGDSKTLSLILPVPYHAEQGTYMVKIALSNNHFHETAYRQIEVI